MNASQPANALLAGVESAEPVPCMVTDTNPYHPAGCHHFRNQQPPTIHEWEAIAAGRYPAICADRSGPSRPPERMTVKLWGDEAHLLRTAASGAGVAPSALMEMLIANHLSPRPAESEPARSVAAPPSTLYSPNVTAVAGMRHLGNLFVPDEAAERDGIRIDPGAEALSLLADLREAKRSRARSRAAVLSRIWNQIDDLLDGEGPA